LSAPGKQDRQRETERERQRERERQGEPERARESQREPGRQTERQTQRDRERQGETGREGRDRVLCRQASSRSIILATSCRSFTGGMPVPFPSEKENFSPQIGSSESLIVPVFCFCPTGLPAALSCS
jgi:hypothetical protein